MKKLYGLLLLVIMFSTIKSQTLYDFPNQLESSYFPKGQNDSVKTSFSSNGAWFGIGLPDSKNSSRWGKIAGPYSFISNEWVGRSLLQFNFGVAGIGKVQLESAKEHEIVQYPGMLYQKFDFGNFLIEEKVIFISGRTCLTKVDAINTSENPIPMTMMMKGTAYEEVGESAEFSEGWMYQVDGKDDVLWLVRFRLDDEMNLSFNPDNYEFSYKEPKLVLPGDTLRMVLTLSQYLKGDPKTDVMTASDGLNYPDKYFERNETLWSYLISNVAEEKEMRDISVKSLQTLFLNLRSSIPDFKNYFFVERTGLDGTFINTEESWLYASSLIRYDSKLATNVLASNLSNFNNNGTLNKIIPVLNYTNSSYDFNEKPMAAWTAWNIFSVNPEADLMTRVYPLLKTYHESWYFNHNYDNNLWCEDVHGVEKADLNALLFSEKYCLMKIAEQIGYEDDVKMYRSQMDSIKLYYTHHFFDVDMMSMVDFDLKDSTKIKNPDAIAYALWSGLAAYDVAGYYSGVIKQQIDAGTFKSTFESGVFDVSYYYFLISGLKLYKFDEESLAIKKMLLDQVLEDSENKPIPSYGNDGMVNDNSSLTASILLLLINY